MKIISNNRQVLPAFHKGLILLWLLILVGNAHAQLLQKVEYFFDTDPGFHAGVAVPVSPPSAHIADFSFDINLTNLSDGFHQLFVRAIDDNGAWSFTNQRSFYKNTFSPLQTNLNKIEYYFDTDPGFGNGTDVPFTPGTHISNLSFAIDITSLDPGFHSLFVRARDSLGIWSFTNQKSFLKTSVETSLQEITAIEYFFDSDPGFGNGTDIPFTPGTHISDLSFAIDITSLDPGFHSLFVRARDSFGIWSLTNQRSFLKTKAETGLQEITAIEYFFDSDPGFGMGTPMPFTPSVQVQVDDFVIDITSLSPGFHKLFVRAKNETGTWALTNSWSFYKIAFSGTTPNVVAAEFFLNTDPGTGQGTPIAVPGNSPNQELAVVIDITNLDPGINKLFVRTLDATGRWSLTNMRVFYKQQFSDMLPDIVYAEYFVDSDPGFGQGTNIPIPVPSPHLTDITFEIDETQLIMGNHMFFVRTRDENGRWSQTLPDVFCRTPKPNFAANAVWIGLPTTFVDLSEFTDLQTQYFWDVNGDGITDYTVKQGFSHTYPSPGVYNVRLILVSQEGCSDTIVKPVYVYSCSPPSNLTAGNITSNSAAMQWTPANMENNWSLEYGPQGFAQGNGTLINNITQTSYSIMGLASATGYDVYVKSYCGGNDFSAWAGPVSFTTLEGEPCVNPANGGTIAASQVICGGSVPEPFTSLLPASEYTGDLQYKWQISQNGVQFFDIGGATGDTYWYNNSVSVQLWFKRLAKVSCEETWDGAAESNVVQIGIEASSQYRSIATGTWTDPSIWEVFNGLTWTATTEYPGQTQSTCPGALVTIRNGHNITIASNITYANVEVAQGGTLVVQQNFTLTITVNNIINVYGTIVMNSTALINGSGGFYLAPGAMMQVGSSQGINISTMAGNIQVTGIRTYASGASYQYIGTTNQVTGDAIGQNIPADVTFNTVGFTVTLSVHLVISGNINIAAGVFDCGGYNLTLSGNWLNQGTFVPGTATVYFVGNTNIYISVSNFYNIVFGGTGTITANGSLNIFGNVTINNYFNAGSFTHYVYGNWVNNGTFVYANSTINFTGSANIIVGAGAFYNVVFSGNNIVASGPLTTYGNVTISGNFNAGSYIHNVYGNWTNTGTFIPGTSTISYVSTGTVTLSETTFYNVIFAGTGTFEAAGSLTIEGDITINGTFDAGYYTHYVQGNWTNNGTFIYGTSTIEFIGSLNIYINVTNFYHVVFGGSGTITATGSLTIYGNVAIHNHFNAGSFDHYIYGNWTNIGTFVHGTSTIHFIGDINKTIGITNFYHVIFGGTGLISASGSITIYGNVTINNYFNAGSFTHFVYGNWINNGVFVYGTSTIHFLGSQNILVSAGNFYHVIFAGSGSITATGSITFYGDVTISHQFDAASFAHYIHGNWVVTGTFIYGTSTIHFVGGLNRLLGSGNFYHVVFDGTGTITATGSLTIYGNITINYYFDAGAFVHYVYGNWINNGTFVYGTSIIRFAGNGNILVGASSFYHLVFACTGNVTATGSLTIYGNVLIENHFNGGSFVHYVYGNWTNNGVYDYGTSTIRFVGDGNIFVISSDFYHVVFEGTAQVVASGSLTIYGNVTISHYFDASSFTHYVYGNWIVNGTFVYNTSVIVFVGNTVQTIGGAIPAVFYGFHVNNTFGIVLYVNVTVYYQLMLTLGIITTDNYSITLNPATEIIGGSATAYINGRLTRGFGTVGARFFPVGNQNLYRPMTFTYLTLTGTSMVEVQLIGNVLSGVPSNVTALPRYWAISQSGGSNFTYTVTLDDPELSDYFGQVRILKCDASITVHATTVPNYTNVNVFTTVSCVGLGVEPCIQPDIPVITPNVSICSGTGTTLEIVSGNLNDALEWVWYADECGTIPVGTGHSIMVSPEVTTTYFVRGESGCAIPGSCAATTVSVISLPEANAGVDGTVCHTSGFTLAGNVTNAQSHTWMSSGDGIFDNPNSLTATYLPGENDILAGSVILTLTAQPMSPCVTSVSSQITLTIKNCHQIVIPAGWSGVSTFVDPVTPAMEDIFEEVVNDLIILQSLTEVYWPGENINTIGNWNIHDGYAIKVANQISLTILGTTSTSRTLQLSQGWNLIPVLSECDANVASLFAGTGVVIVKEVAGWQIYWPAFNINTIGNLHYGKAYFVFMDAPATVTYPACLPGSMAPGTNSTNFKMMEELINTSPWNIFERTAQSHIIGIAKKSINPLLIKPGDYLGVFDQLGQCYGLVKWEGENTTLTAFGDDPTTPGKDGFVAGESLYYRIFVASTSKECELEATYDQVWPQQDGLFTTNGLSAIGSFKLGTTQINESADYGVLIYPNPADDFLLIDLGKPRDVEMTLIDAQGKEVLKQILTSLRNQLDISALRSGVYFVKFEGQEFNKIEKIIKK